MIKKKKFYMIILIFILFIFALSFIFNKDKALELSSDKLIYKNGIIYSAGDREYTGRVTESDGFKARINDKQITDGYISVRNGELNGKFEFESSYSIWENDKVSGKASDGKIEKLVIESVDGKKINLKTQEDIRKFFSENLKSGVSAEKEVLMAVGFDVPE